MYSTILTFPFCHSTITMFVISVPTFKDCTEMTTVEMNLHFKTKKTCCFKEKL